MTIPLRSMINTPSTPLCEEIRAIVSSISAAVDDSTASLVEELISTVLVGISNEALLLMST